MSNMMTNDEAQWAVLRAEQQARHGAAIAYVRRQVEPGMEYANEIARAVFSDAGAYFELRELPEEFVGAVGDGVTQRLVSVAEADEIIRGVRALTEEITAGRFVPRALSLYVLYAGGSLRRQTGMFVFDYAGAGAAPFTHGAWQTGQPRVFKLRLHLAPGQPPPLGLPASGLAFFLAPTHTDSGQCLFATITRDADTRDLSAPISTGGLPQ